MKINEILKEVLLKNEISILKSWLFDTSNLSSNDNGLDSIIKKEFVNLKSYILQNQFEIRCGKVNYCYNCYEHIFLYQTFQEKSICDESVKENIKEIVDELIHFGIFDYIMFFDENENKNYKIICLENEKLKLGNKLSQTNYDNGNISYSERHVDKNGYGIVYHCVGFTSLYK